MKILIQMTYMNNIGGIETAMFQFARKFYKRAEIEFVINAYADGAQEQFKRLEKFGKVTIDKSYSEKHTADVAFIFTPIMQNVPWDTIEAKKVYQFIHSDISGLMDMAQWRDFRWTPNPKISKILSVSTTARDGLKKALGLDSEVVPNIFDPDDSRRVFIFNSRATAEKGFDKVLKLVERFDAEGRDYLLIVSSLIDPYGPYWDTLYNNPRIVYAGASIYNDSLLRAADYLLQLSTCESYCYSIREALARKVAVIGSKIPEIQKVVKDGVNGYLLDDDLSNLDLDKIFNEVPKVRAYKETIDPIWDKVLEGEL